MLLVTLTLVSTHISLFRTDGVRTSATLWEGKIIMEVVKDTYTRRELFPRIFQTVLSGLRICGSQM